MFALNTSGTIAPPESDTTEAAHCVSAAPMSGFGPRYPATKVQGDSTVQFAPASPSWTVRFHHQAADPTSEGLVSGLPLGQLTFAGEAPPSSSGMTPPP